jgi:hypothetical protein
VEILTARVEGAVPLAAPNVSHVAVLEAVQESVPLPVFVMLKDCDAGFAPPALPAKLRVLVDKLRTG